MNKNTHKVIKNEYGVFAFHASDGKPLSRECQKKLFAGPVCIARKSLTIAALGLVAILFGGCVSILAFDSEIEVTQKHRHEGNTDAKLDIPVVP